jgi:hypothetical protein
MPNRIPIAIKSPPTIRGPRRATFAFACILVAVLLDMLAIGIIIPVLPNPVVDLVGAMPRRGRVSTGCPAPSER